MRKTVKKPLNTFVRKFAWLPVKRLDAVVKSQDKVKQEAHYTVFWLEHYWQRETINPSRQLSISYFSDTELFEQEYLPAVTSLLSVRTEEGTIELSDKIRDTYLNLMVQDVDPETAVQKVTGKTFYQFWLDTAAQLFHINNLVESPTANNHKLAKDLFDLYQGTDYVKCHPIEIVDLLLQLKQENKFIVRDTGTKIHITLNIKNKPIVLEY